MEEYKSLRMIVSEKYSVPYSLIDGETQEEMEASAKALQAFAKDNRTPAEVEMARFDAWMKANLRKKTDIEALEKFLNGN